MNAFTAKSVKKITGISVHMLNYLCRHGYMAPAYPTKNGTRGEVRYFSYRDLVIARVIQRLRRNGVKLAKIKKAVEYLRHDRAWFANGPHHSDPVQWLVSDGREPLLIAEDGFLDELRPGGQRAFAFIVSLEGIQTEIRSILKRREPKKLPYFAIENRPLIFERKRSTRSTIRNR